MKIADANTVKKARVIIIDTIIMDINDCIDVLKRNHKTYDCSPLSPVTILEQKRWDLCTERRQLNEELAKVGKYPPVPCLQHNGSLACDCGEPA